MKMTSQEIHRSPHHRPEVLPDGSFWLLQSLLHLCVRTHVDDGTPLGRISSMYSRVLFSQSTNREAIFELKQTLARLQ